MATTAKLAVAAVLAADATLVALLGSADCVITGRYPVNELDTPDAYAADAGSGVVILQPCLVVADNSEATVGPGGGIGREQWLRLSALSANDYGRTNDIQERVHALLHDTHIPLTNGAWLHTEHVDTPIPQGDDPSVETGVGGTKGACLSASRYRVTSGWGAY